MKQILYDFYTTENNMFFNREEMTEQEAQKYAEEFCLTFKEVEEDNLLKVKNVRKQMLVKLTNK